MSAFQSHASQGVELRSLLAADPERYDAAMDTEVTQTFAGVTPDQLWEVARRHGVIRLRVFGSWARGEALRDSDLDLLVRLENGRDLLDLVGLKQDLEDLVGRAVDVVEEDGMSPYMKDSILRDARSL